MVTVADIDPETYRVAGNIVSKLLSTEKVGANYVNTDQVKRGFKNRKELEYFYPALELLEHEGLIFWSKGEGECLSVDPKRLTDSIGFVAKYADQKRVDRIEPIIRLAAPNLKPPVEPVPFPEQSKAQRQPDEYVPWNVFNNRVAELQRGIRVAEEAGLSIYQIKQVVDDVLRNTQDIQNIKSKLGALEAPKVDLKGFVRRSDLDGFKVEVAEMVRGIVRQVFSPASMHEFALGASAVMKELDAHEARLPKPTGEPISGKCTLCSDPAVVRIPVFVPDKAKWVRRQEDGFACRSHRVGSAALVTDGDVKQLYKLMDASDALPQPNLVYAAESQTRARRVMDMISRKKGWASGHVKKGQPVGWPHGE